MIHVQGLRRNVKNVVKNYSDAQVKVREATSNDPWGPSGTLMSEIADLTYNVVAFSEIMQVIWKRLNDHGKNWKHVYKALVLLEYLIKTGSEKVTQQCRENLFAIQTLRDFQYFEESKDQGVNVREKAKQLVALLKDEERLKSERARALKARERFARSAAACAKQETMPRPYGSAEFSPSSLDEDMLSPAALSLSELEHARPQTAGEEELQLQLALAMSKEEADQAERLKRNDDLRLQMALSESEEEFKKNKPTKKPELPQSASAIEDLLGLNLNANGGNQAAAVDPWGMPLTASSDSNTLDVWNTNSDVPEANRNVVENDLWSPALDNSNTGMQNNSLIRSSQDNISDSQIFDLSNMKKSLSADASTCPVSSGAPAPLDAYLNTESSLINFDQSLPRSRTLGLPSEMDPSESRIKLMENMEYGNPFQAARPSPLTINELRARNTSQTLPGPSENTLPMSSSMPLSNTLHTNASYWSPKNNVSQSQNPFM